MFSDSQFTGEDISALDIKMPGRAVLFMDSGEYPLQLLFWFGVFFCQLWCGNHLSARDAVRLAGISYVKFMYFFQT